MALSSWSGALYKTLITYVNHAHPSFNYLYKNVIGKKCMLQQCCVIQCKTFSSNSNASKNTNGNETPLSPKKKKVFIPRVTLLSENNEISIVTLETAERIAQRRNFKLVKIVDYDTKTSRPTYRLMSSKDYIQEGLQRKQEKKRERETSTKSEKLMSISSKITEHDLYTKIRSVSKLLSKKHEVRIAISVDNSKEIAEGIAYKIETELKDMVQTVRRTSSRSSLKIYLRPIIEEKITEESSIEDSNTEVEDNKTEPVPKT